MQRILSIPFIHAIAHVSKETIYQKVATVKAILTNETVQKIVLFSTILGLLLIAANLEAIM